jgi:hypothetical protein
MDPPIQLMTGLRVPVTDPWASATVTRRERARVGVAFSGRALSMQAGCELNVTFDSWTGRLGLFIIKLNGSDGLTQETWEEMPMPVVRLCTDDNADVICPRRGLIDVEWCFGCSNREQTVFQGDETVIYCDPGIDPPYHESTLGPLHDVPTDLGS